MTTCSTYEHNGQIYKITVKPPNSETIGVFPSAVVDLNFTVEVNDDSDRQIYIGTISSLLAVNIRDNYGVAIPEWLTHIAKTIINNRG